MAAEETSEMPGMTHRQMMDRKVEEVTATTTTTTIATDAAPTDD